MFCVVAGENHKIHQKHDKKSVRMMTDSSTISHLTAEDEKKVVYKTISMSFRSMQSKWGKKREKTTK